jgi:SOS response regulatory protein OraA/RecX
MPGGTRTANHRHPGAATTSRSSASESAKVLAAALAALGRRFHSRAGLKAKLADKGFSPGSIAEAEEKLEGWGYLDDLKHGRAWAESRVRVRGEGPSKIRAGLRRLGVPSETAREIVAGIYAETPQEGLIEAAIDRWCRARGVDPATADPAALRRLAHHLSGRGFAETLLFRAIRNRRR